MQKNREGCCDAWASPAVFFTVLKKIILIAVRQVLCRTAGTLFYLIQPCCSHPGSQRQGRRRPLGCSARPPQRGSAIPHPALYHPADSSTCAVLTSFLFLSSLGYYYLWLIFSHTLGFPALTCLWTPPSTLAQRQVKEEAEPWLVCRARIRDFPCFPPDSSRRGIFVQCSPESLTWDAVCLLHCLCRRLREERKAQPVAGCKGWLG